MDTKTIIKELSDAAIASVMPGVFIPAQISLNGSKLTVRDKTYELASYRCIYIIAIGKAAMGMAEALDRIIHPYVTEGIILTKHIPGDHLLDKRYRILPGNHPVPGNESVTGAKTVLGLADKAGAEDLVLFLISGGGSSLMTLPLDGIDLDTFRQFSNSILSSGADINEFNILRKHLLIFFQVRKTYLYFLSYH